MVPPKKKAAAAADPASVAEERCSECEKKTSLCVCASIQPQANRLHVFLYQHPQEPDKDLGTARIASLALNNSTLRVGLSSPNLKKAMEEEAVVPSEWAVLYLGSGVKPDSTGSKPTSGVVFVSKSGSQLPESEERRAIEGLKGVIVLDGTWSQAKALWWRNPWLLKCRRIVLLPKQPSMYGKLRKEPRKECLSTIETIAEVLDGLGEAPAVGEHLRSLFRRLLQRYRDEAARRKAEAPKPQKKKREPEQEAAAAGSGQE